MKKREIVLLVILIILLCGAGYYLFYYTPMSERIVSLETGLTQKTAELDLATQQVLLWGTLSASKEKHADSWKFIADTVPEDFDDADVLTRVQKIIIPHTRDVDIKFPESATPLEATAVYPVEISFTVSYDTLQTILKDFAKENIANRIVVLDFKRIEPAVPLSVASDAEDESETVSVSPESQLMVYMVVDFLTRTQPAPVPEPEQ